MSCCRPLRQGNCWGNLLALSDAVSGLRWARAGRVQRVGVPDYETLMRPTLAALASGQPQTRSQIRDAVAQATGIEGDDLEEMLPSGKATVFGSRVGWALTYMAQAGLVTRPKRGGLTDGHVHVVPNQTYELKAMDEDFFDDES